MTSPFALHEWDLLSNSAAKDLVLHNLGLPYAGDTQSAGVSPPLAAEALRAALWTLASGSNGSTWSPVYVTRLLNQARRLAFSSAEAQGEEADDSAAGADLFRNVLNELETIGDLASLPRGCWLPAPVRCVPLVEIQRWLLVGGVPSRYLPVSLDAREHVGTARLLKHSPIGLGLEIPTQARDDWLRSPREALSTWTHKVIKSIKTVAYEGPDADFTFYLPKFTPAAERRLQYWRWRPRPKNLPDGRYLARSMTAFGLVHYSVAEVAAGRVAATRELNLQDGGIRRLMYGLDAASGFPVDVKADTASRQVTYFLANELPGPESRLFLALGTLAINPDGNYYPRRWKVQISYSAEIDEMLARLQVRILKL